MQRNTKILLGIFIILFIVIILFKGDITGRAVECSETPEIILAKTFGDTISLDWTDTSIFTGQVKYEIVLYRKENETYEIIDSDITKEPFISFPEIHPGTYIVKIRAKNNPGCAIEYTNYVASEEIVQTYR